MCSGQAGLHPFHVLKQSAAFLSVESHFMSETLHASCRVPFGLGGIRAFDGAKGAALPFECLEWVGRQQSPALASISAPSKGRRAPSCVQGARQVSCHG